MDIGQIIQQITSSKAGQISIVTILGVLIIMYGWKYWQKCRAEGRSALEQVAEAMAKNEGFIDEQIEKILDPLEKQAADLLKAKQEKENSFVISIATYMIEKHVFRDLAIKAINYHKDAFIAKYGKKEEAVEAPKDYPTNEQ